jgi:flagellar hook-associated protein 3 FlgL
MNRISSFLPHDNMQFHLRNREFRMNEMSNKLGSQTRLKQLRDDPLAAGRATRFQSGVTRMARYNQNIRQVRNHLNYTEGYVREAVDMLQRINEITVQGANGVWSKEQLGYMAQEIDQLLNELIHVGNSKSETGEALFSGFQVQSDAFRVTKGRVSGTGQVLVRSVDYIGDIGQNMVEISEGAVSPLNLAGNSVFWAENQQIYSAVEASDYRVQADSMIRIDGVEIRLNAGDNVHAIISKINDSAAPVRARLDPVQNSLVLQSTTPHQIWVEDIGDGRVMRDIGVVSDVDRYPPLNIADTARVYGGSIYDMIINVRDRMFEGDTLSIGGSGLRGISDAISNLSTVLAEIGAQDNRLRVTSERLAYEIPEMIKMGAEEADIDVTEAITELKMLEYAHRAALSTTARILKPTLLDFLR